MRMVGWYRNLDLLRNLYSLETLLSHNAAQRMIIILSLDI